MLGVFKTLALKILLLTFKKLPPEVKNFSIKVKLGQIVRIEADVKCSKESYEVNLLCLL